jgi:hypothetical protein
MLIKDFPYEKGWELHNCKLGKNAAIRTAVLIRIE